jgi:outer membrane receptor protein involved in Fe transport
VGVIVDESRGPTENIVRVGKSEKIIGHDLQINWKTDSFHLSTTLFYMSIADFISFDAFNTPQGYKNLGKLQSLGGELEGRWYIADPLALYGNYSYALATLDDSRHQGALTDGDDTTLNYPRHIMNIGLDWLVNDKNTLNANMNSWYDMSVVLPINSGEPYGAFDKLNGEIYFDLSFTSMELFHTPLDLNIFVLNLLNNTDPVGMVINGGFWYPRGRNVGATLSLRI